MFLSRTRTHSVKMISDKLNECADSWLLMAFLPQFVYILFCLINKDFQNKIITNSDELCNQLSVGDVERNFVLF